MPELLPAMLAALLGGAGARTGTLPGALLCLMALLQLLCSAPRGSGLAHGRRLICWQALLQCQGEPDCSYAYSQYAEACAPVLAQRGGADAPGPAGAFPASAASSPRWRCPSHCISALIQLNHTRRGPALEDCDCAQDEHCRSTKRAIEPCLPRTSSVGPGAGAGSVMGCTEARRRCDRDSRCNLALSRYLAYCGKLFNGLRCTDECRAVIEDMLAVPKALGPRAASNPWTTTTALRARAAALLRRAAAETCPTVPGAGAAAAAVEATGRIEAPGPRLPVCCCCCSCCSGHTCSSCAPAAGCSRPVCTTQLVPEQGTCGSETGDGREH